MSVKHLFLHVFPLVVKFASVEIPYKRAVVIHPRISSLANSTAKYRDNQDNGYYPTTGYGEKSGTIMAVRQACSHILREDIFWGSELLKLKNAASEVSRFTLGRERYYRVSYTYPR